MESKNNQVGRFIKHSYVYAIGNIINRLGAFLLLPIYTNYLTTAEFGLLELFYGISTVVFGVLSIGIAHATLRFYFEFDSEKDRKSVISTNFLASLVISLVGVSIVAYWSDSLSLLVFNSEQQVGSIYLILATIVVELSSQVCLAYVRALERSMFFVYISIAKLVIQVAFNIYFVIYAGYGVEGILLGNLIAVAVGWIVLSYFTVSRCGLGFDSTKIGMILQYSYPFLLGTISALVANNVDKFSLNYLNSAGAVGIYMLARKFSMLIEQLIGEPFSRSYGSFRFSIMKDANASDIQASITKYLFYATISIALLMSMFISDLLALMSAKEFHIAGFYVPIVLLASILKVMNYPAQTGILYSKKTKNIFYIGLIAALISVSSNLILIPMIGILGACIAVVISEFVYLLLTHLRSQKYFYVKYHYKEMAKFFVLALITFQVSMLFSTENALGYFFIKLLLVISFAVIVIMSPMFLTEQEKSTISDSIHKFFSHLPFVGRVSSK